MNEELMKLEEKILERQKILNADINHALNINDDSAYQELKQKELQCMAELRLIKHIKNDFKGDFLIC